MAEFSSQDFINSLTDKLSGDKMPACRFCGNTTYAVLPDFTGLSQQKDVNKIFIGKSLPVGTVMCSKCGHLEMFALGVLGVLPKKGVEQDATERDSTAK